MEAVLTCGGNPPHPTPSFGSINPAKFPPPTLILFDFSLVLLIMEGNEIRLEASFVVTGLASSSQEFVCPPGFFFDS